VKRGSVALALALAGCHRAPGVEGRWSRCTCEYVTDYDQPGHAVVEVCVAGGDANRVAAPCAEGLGVGAVTKCVCEPPAEASCGAAIGTCREEADRPR
jgi:hypothetical protein